MNTDIVQQSLKNKIFSIVIHQEVINQIYDKQQYANIKKIYCYNTNKEVAYNLFKKKLNFKHKKIKNFKKIFRIKRFIFLIKKSGFFSYIKTFQSKKKLDGSFAFIITAKVNPIVKQISISNCYNLQIPSVLLRKIFINQVGLPENYKKLQKSITHIHNWYTSRGFKFAQIKLIRQHFAGQLLLHIDEGIIGKIEIISIINTPFNQQLISNIQKSIHQELNFRPGLPLNIKKLERYLVYLKKQKFFQDCNYTTYLNNNLIYLKIYFNIIPTPQINLYLINQNSYNRRKFIQNLYKDSKLKKVINYQPIVVKIQQLYSCIRKIQQDLVFDYCFIYQKKYTYYLKIKAKIDKQLYKAMSCTSKYIHLYIQQARIFYLTSMEVNHQRYDSKIFYPFIYIKYNKKLYSMIHKLRAQLNGLNLLFNHKLIQEINVSENISIRGYINNKNQISLGYHFIEKIENINHQINLISTNFKKYLQITQNRLIYIELSLKYNSLYLIDSLPIGRFIVIDSKLFYSIKPNKNGYIKNYQYLGQTISSTYINHYYIPYILPGIYKSIVVFLIDIKYIIKKALISPMYCNNYYALQYDHFHHYKNIIQYCYCLLKTELHLYKWKYLSIYFFYDVNNNENLISYDRKMIEQTINKISLKHKGIGIQLNIPIKNLTNINIKYNKNNKNRSSVIITNYSKYN